MDALLEKIFDIGGVEEILPNICSLPTSTERVQYVYKNLWTHGVLPLPSPQLPPAKSAAVSVSHRTAGNTLYARGENIKALECYNKAINNAPAGSSELSLGYSNRSAVLLTLGKHDDALVDISRSLDIGCEERIKEKLIRRQNTCEVHKAAHRELNDTVAASIIFRESVKKHPNIPCASAKIDISYDSRCGRKIVATADIKPGEVLVVEKVYSSLLELKNCLVRCYHCCELAYSMIPCEGCNRVMFCGEDCQKISWDEYHEYECKMMPYYLKDDSPNQGLLSLRIVLKAKHEYQSWAALSEAVSAINAENNPIKKGYMNVGDKQIYDQKYYSSVHALETNEGKAEDIDVISTTLRTTLFLYLLTTYTDIFDNREWSELAEDDLVWFAGGLLLHNAMMVSTNGQKIYWMSKNSETFTLDPVAGGIFSFSSLFNHSCNQNMAKVNMGRSVAVLSTRSIKKGEEIFDNYGASYEANDLPTRRKMLELFKFVCHCEACENNWPTLLNCVSVAHRIEYSTVSNLLMECLQICKALKYGKVKTIEYTMGKIYEKILILENHLPCQEFLEYRSRLHAWWYSFANYIE